MYRFLSSSIVSPKADYFRTMKKSLYGLDAEMTDFAVLLGGKAIEKEYRKGFDRGKLFTGNYWVDGGNKVFAHGPDGDTNLEGHENRRVIGARIFIDTDGQFEWKTDTMSNTMYGVYGEYPQSLVDDSVSADLEEAYKNNELIVTGRKYTTDSVPDNQFNTGFSMREHIEYEFNGEQYVRVLGDEVNSARTLSNGKTVEVSKPYWVKVEPIIWHIEDFRSQAVSDKILFAGVQFNDKEYSGNFESTTIFRFVRDCFKKEIIAERTYPKNLRSVSVKEEKEDKNEEVLMSEEKSKESVRKRNPYNFDFSATSATDIIKGAIESKVPVFLHGKPGEGKSARVKQFDPDCEIIYMINANYDSFVGKSALDPNTKEMFDVPPTWYTNVMEKCEKEPDKIHLVFFDELTNAPHSVQGMAFNVILNGEINGKWKFPDNVRFVAAGNELSDSMSSFGLSEPLYGRFAHVNINTTVDDWAKWAFTPDEEFERLDYIDEVPKTKIHPAIYAYITYKSYSGEDVLRTPYNGKTPNADPRKWELASRVLYKTGKPDMLKSLVGEELTADFMAFSQQQVITVEDVINNNYTDSDLSMNTAEQFATAVGLSSVDEEHFPVVRSFMEKVGPEPRAAFDSMWTHGDEKRLEKLAEVRLSESLKQGGKSL